MAKAMPVSATGVPSEPKWRTPAPTKNVIPAPMKRAKDVEKAKALARHSVGYCSGSHRVYTEKLAPPRPRKNRQTKNNGKALLVEIENLPESQHDKNKHQSEEHCQRGAAAVAFG